MRATIRRLDTKLPYCDAQTGNDIVFVFRPPPSGLRVGDVIEFDHHVLEVPRVAQNVTLGTTFTVQLREQDIHDLRLPAVHGSSRFPTPQRFNER
jgi:hypothetical protein